MKELTNDRIAAAAKTYLERKGYDVLETMTDREHPVIVAEEDGTLVFASVAGAIGEWPEREFGREEFEAVAASYLTIHDVTDVPLRADEIDIMAVADGRAILRHCINCPGVSSAA